MKRFFQFLPLLLLFFIACSDDLSTENLPSEESALELRDDDIVDVEPGCPLTIVELDDPEEECCKYSICVPEQTDDCYYTIESTNPNSQLVGVSSSYNPLSYIKPKTDPLGNLYPVFLNCWELTTCQATTISVYKRVYGSLEKELVCQESVECTPKCCDDLCFTSELLDIPTKGGCFSFRITIEGDEECVGPRPFDGLIINKTAFALVKTDHVTNGAIFKVCAHNDQSNPDDFTFSAVVNTSQCGSFEVGPFNPTDISSKHPNMCD